MNRKPKTKTVRESVRGSVPRGLLKEARVVVTDDLDRLGIGGYTQYERESGRGKVIKIATPSTDDYRGITIRGHETAHAARHKPQRRKPMTANEAIASQMIDDVNVESQFVPRVRNDAHRRIYLRAHLAQGINDLRHILNRARSIRSSASADTVEARNAQTLLATRVLAMLRSYGEGDLRSRDVAMAKLRDAIGYKMVEALEHVVSMGISRRKRNMAISMLVALLERVPDPDSPDEDEPKEGDDLEGIIKDGGEGTAIDGKMRIIDLRPKNVFCAKEKTITRRYTPDGVHLNAGRYVNAIVSGDAHGLFSRRVRQKLGGTVLIDASGSMHANREILSKICQLVPTATVAYYSGFDGRGKGDLVVYALNGKRYAGELPRETIHGGNAIDLPAIKWMMRMPKPWTLVSDLGFVGGNIGAEIVAHALVSRATERGELTVHHSLDAAYEAFGGKGELPDTPRRSRRPSTIPARILPPRKA